MTASLESRDLIAELHRIAAIPSIGDEQHHRSAMQNAPAPTLVEFANGVTDPCTSGPIRRGARHRRERRVRPADAQLSRDTRESRREQKRLDALVTLVTACAK